MTRTPDEIKKGLAYLATRDVEKKCKLWQEGIAYAWQEDAAADALAYIQQLERDKAWTGETSDMLREENKRLEAQTAEQAEKIRVLEASLMDEVSKTKLIHVVDLNDDAAKVIQQLQTENAELSGKIGRLQEERDAAVADLAHVKDCDTCKYDDACLTGKKDCFGCHEESCPCLPCKYEWRGVQKEAPSC